MGTEKEIIIRESTGERFEVIPINTVGVQHTHYMKKGGTYFEFDKDVLRYGPGVRAEDEPAIYLRLLRKRHTFGGVVYEETGEERVPLLDEWAMTEDSVHYFHYGAGLTRAILKPIGTISPDGKILYKNDGTNEAVE